MAEEQKQSDEAVKTEKAGFLKKAATFAESIASRGLNSVNFMLFSAFNPNRLYLQLGSRNPLPNIG